MAVFTGSIFNDTIIPGNVSPFVIRNPIFSTPSNANDSLYGNGGNDTMDGGGGNDFLDGGVGNDVMRGGAGNDVMYGRDGADTMDGGAGDDRMYGGGGNDVMRGGGGVDTVFGEDGNDTIYSSGRGTYDGGAGNDVIYAASGLPETLRGGTGVDLLDTTSWAGNYTINMTTGATNYAGESFTQFENLRTGAGADSIFGTVGANDIRTGSGDDSVRGGGGNDRLYGEAGNDTLRGEAGNDTAFGGVGNDTIFGDAGNDFLYGESGNDRITGGSGADIVNGGTGSDTFVYLSTSDSSGALRDVIQGFDGAGFFGASQDRIDLSAIDANTLFLAPGNQAFTFWGVQTTAQGLARGPGSLWVENVGAETIVNGNTDFDNTIELSIRIADGATVAANYWAGDFVL